MWSSINSSQSSTWLAHNENHCTQSGIFFSLSSRKSTGFREQRFKEGFTWQLLHALLNWFLVNPTRNSGEEKWSESCRKSGAWGWGLHLGSDKDREEEVTEDILELLADKRLTKLANKVDIFYQNTKLEKLNSSLRWPGMAMFPDSALLTA